METEKTLGQVTSVDDPGKSGAIKVALPDTGGDEYPEWIEPVHPGGVYFHPKPGDTVEVTTPAGDEITEYADMVRYAGVLTSEAEGYPEEFKKNYPDRRGVKTPGGHLVILDDKTGDIIITNGKTGDQVTLSPDMIVSLKAGVKAHLNAPLTELSDVSTDPVIKGTTFNAAFTPALDGQKAMGNAMATTFAAMAALCVGPLAPLADGFTVLATAQSTFVGTVDQIKGLVATWLSAKVTTG